MNMNNKVRILIRVADTLKVKICPNFVEIIATNAWVAAGIKKWEIIPIKKLEKIFVRIEGDTKKIQKEQYDDQIDISYEGTLKKERKGKVIYLTGKIL